MKRIYLICCIMVFLLGGCRNRCSPQQLSLSDESEEINSLSPKAINFFLKKNIITTIYLNMSMFLIHGKILLFSKKITRFFISIQLRSKQLITIITLASIFFQREPYTAFRCKIRTLKQFSAAMELSHFSL